MSVRNGAHAASESAVEEKEAKGKLSLTVNWQQKVNPK
jgi:hypothetical protein